MVWRFLKKLKIEILCAVLYLVPQSYPTLFDSMNCSPPGSSVYGDSPGKNTGEGCHARWARIPAPMHDPEKNTVWKDEGTPVCTAALFAIVWTWKQPTTSISRCVVHIYIEWNITQPLKRWNNAICNHMDGPGDYHTQWSKTEKDKLHMQQQQHGTYGI